MVDENYEPMRGGSAGFDWEGQARRVREELEGLNELRVRVQIAGPRAVSEEVDHFFEVVRDEVGKAVEGYDTRVENLNSWWEDFATLLAHEEEARYRFIAAVRDTLENPPG